MIDKHFIQLHAAKLIVVGRCEDTVHATSRRDDRYIGPCATKIRDDNDLVCDLGFRPCVVRQ